MKYKTLAWVAVLGAAASASAANAQLTPDRMVQGRVARSVLVTGTANVEYNSNVARTSEARAAQEGLRLEDITYTPSVNANLILPVGRQALFLDGIVGYVGHEHNSQLDNTHVNVNGGVGNSVGPCGSVLTGGYFRGRSELGNTTLVSDVQDLQEVKRIDLSVTCLRKTGIGVFIDGSRSWATNSLPQSANGNYQSTVVSGGFSYQRPSFGSISVTASDAKTDYSNDGIAALLTGASSFESKSTGLKLERRLGGRIQASVSVSYTKAEVDQGLPVGATVPSSRNFSGLTYSGDLTFRASSRLQLHGGFSRAVNPSLITGGSFQVDTDYQVGVSYSLGSRIRLALTGIDQETTVHGNIPIALAATTLTDAKSKRVEASAEYRLNKRLSFILSARHEARDANNPLFAYDADAVGVSAAVRF